MHKVLFSIDKLGIFIDTKEWGLGFNFHLNLDENLPKHLFEINLLCLHFYIAI